MADRQDRADRPDQTAWLAGGQPDVERRTVAVALAATVCWTVAPLFVAARYEPILQLYVSPSTYIVLVGSTVVLTGWLFVDGLDLDRFAVGYAVVFGPALLTGVAVPSLAYLGIDMHSFVIDERFLDYTLAITIGGLAAIGLSLLTERLSAGRPFVPGRRTVAFAAVTTALGVGAAAGRRYATPPSGTIEWVGLGYTRWGVFVHVVLEAESGPLHVTLVAPGGQITRTRVTAAHRTGDPMMMQVPAPEDSPYSGRYDVRLEPAVGRPIDSASATVEEGPRPSIRRVETRTTGRNSRIATVVVENVGDATGEFELTLREDGEELDSDDLWIGPGSDADETLVINHDPREGARNAVVTVRFDGPESDTRIDQREITFGAS